LRTSGRPLLTLLVVMAVVNCGLGFYNVALEVLAIDIAGSARAGVIFATAGATMIAGSLWVGRRGVPHRRMRALVCGLAVMGAGALVSAVRPSVVWLVAGVVVALALVPVLNASTATIFHERVPQRMQGRVFGLRFAIGRALDPVGAVLGGVVIGTRDSRGAALVLVGVAVALVVLAAWLRRSSAYAALDTSQLLEASRELAVTAV
jgi:MFS family permease